MIFDPDALLQLAAQLAAKQGIPLPLTRETMSAIVDEAERLAGGDERDEPAALFYACALRAAAFGKIATPFFDDIAAAQAAAAPAQAGPPKTPSELVAAAPASAWRAIPADELLVITLKSGGQVVVQLAPAFAPVHVANIRTLAKANYWDGAAIYRVQDNYVAQWGSGESEKPFPAGFVANPPAEYHRALAGLEHAVETKTIACLAAGRVAERRVVPASNGFGVAGWNCYRRVQFAAQQRVSTAVVRMQVRIDDAR